MSDYLNFEMKPIIDELAQYIDITITYEGTTINKQWGDDEPRNFYNVEIYNRFNQSGMNVRFWDSISNTQKGYKMRTGNLKDEYSVLACLQNYEVGSFNDFCWEFGCNSDSIKDFRLYQDVCAEWEDVCRVFTEKQLELLREIN